MFALTLLKYGHPANLLLDPMQLVDELSMIYTTCLMAYASFSYSRNAAFRLTLAISLIGLSLFITLYYHYLQDPSFHQNAYALLTTVVVFRTTFIMEYTLRPSLRRSEEKHRRERKEESRDLLLKEDQARLNVRDKAILKNMWILVAYGLSMFLGGFAIWTLDNVHCSRLRSWRRQIGLPWGVLLEGHGWW
jgi:dihydroceramidase